MGRVQGQSLLCLVKQEEEAVGDVCIATSFPGVITK